MSRFVLPYLSIHATNHKTSHAENGQLRTPRRHQVSPSRMNDYIEIGQHHLPNFESLDREFEWNSPDLADFRCQVAYRSLNSLFLATALPSINNAPSPYQDALIGELLAHGISPAEVARAMTRAGTSEAVALAIVENVADSTAGPLRPIASTTVEPRNHVEPQHSVPQERDSGADIKSVLFYIAEEQSRQKAYVHHGIRCDSCGEMPIRGIRWHCSNCTDFDLCSNCEAQNPSPHIKTHVFHKITIPALHLSKSWKVEPVWYPGNPFLMQRTLPKDLVKQLSNDCSYEPFEVEAIYDQFTCVANVQWREDPLNINAAIDRSAFNRSIMPHTTLRPPAPNLIYERCFAFYDTDSNGLIGFDEFLHGLAYIHKRAFRDQRLLKIFDGYDMDSDGYVSRKDFLRMFRALYTVQQELTSDMIAVQEEQAADEPRSDLVSSSQPLSSAFRERFLRGSLTRRPGKTVDRFGDPLPGPGYSTIVADSGRQASRADTTGMMESQADRGSQSMEETWRRRNFYIGGEEDVAARSSEARIGVGFIEDEESEPNGNFGNEIGSDHDDDFGQRSRSSSRVRFKDEPDDDVRSQTSTSSRPIGERWGGYDIPEAEADVGKEVIYNVIQESLNLLLDPLFRPAEDLTLEIRKTEAERHQWKDQIALVERETCAIEAYNARQNDPLLETARMQRENLARTPGKNRPAGDFANELMQEALETPAFQDCLTIDDYEHAARLLGKLQKYVEWALPYLKGTPDQPDIETCSEKYKSYVEDGQDEIKAIAEKVSSALPSAPTAHPLYRRVKDLEQQAVLARTILSPSTEGMKMEACGGSKSHVQDRNDRPQDSNTLASPNQPFEGPEIDPTLPQFRPNSSTDISPLNQRDTASLPYQSPPNPSSPCTADQSVHSLLGLPTPPPPRPHLRRLVMLEQMEREQRRRGRSGGKLGFEEFERVMRGTAGTKLEFLDDWLTLISF